MKTITAKQIHDDLSAAKRPTLYTNQPVPLNELSDRAFEILLYHIFQERVKIKDPEVLAIADNVSLMQGVGEQGRDVILSKNGNNTGVIQCKKHRNNISRMDVSCEVIKFILHYYNDSDLIHDLDNFTYYFVASTGFTGNSIGSFNDFGKYLTEEPKLKEWTLCVMGDYAAFKSIKYADVEKTIKNVLAKIKIRKVIPPDIEFWLSEFDVLSKMFFKILTVTDNTLLEQTIENYLKPILNKLTTLGNVDKPDYSFRFKEYLKEAYEEYSSAKTLVFGNQQKKLEEIYYPLSVVKIDQKKQTKEEYLIDKYNEDFIPKYRKVLITDNGGMGKSTLLKWLFLSVIKQNKGIPLFIELRKLHTGNDILNEITRKLNPLNVLVEKEATSQILSNKGFIIFFDGYDEVKNENREFVTDDLMNFIKKCPNSDFVITSRPEKALIAFSNFQEFNVRKLNKAEAFELIRKLDNNQDRSLRLIEQVEQKKIGDVEEFLSNPLLVSLLYKKFEYRETIPFKKQEFFYEVFEALFHAHDLSKGESYTRDKESKLGLSEFFQVLRYIGFKCLKEGIEFNEAQLSGIIEEVKNDVSKPFDTSLLLNDLTKAVPLFQRDGLTIKWAHKSIQQYFAAEYICRDGKEDQEEILLNLFHSTQVEKYEPVLQICYEIDYKSFKATVLREFCEKYLNYSAQSFLKLKTILPKKVIDDRIGYIYEDRFFLQANVSLRHDSETDKMAAKFWNISVDDIAHFGYETIEGHTVCLDFSNYDRPFRMKDFLVSVKSDLVSQEVPDVGGDENHLMELSPTLTENEVFFFDDDDPTKPLNTLENFLKLNNALHQLVDKINHDNVVKLYAQILIEQEISAKHKSKYDF